MKNMKIATRVSLLVLLVMIIGFLGLWMAVDNKSSDMVGELIEGQMKDAVSSRAYIIDSYVKSAEEYMVAFAKSDEVRNLLLDPQSVEYTKRAQEYTVEFAAVKGVFEGLYIATPETLVLTHTSEGAIGITTRSGDGLKQLQDEILSTEKLTNIGILKSPTTGNMCMSMYYPVYENGKCIGFVGAAVYASQLMDSLLSLEVKGLPQSQYVFLNVSNGEYLYNENEELLCTVTQEEGYEKILQQLREGTAEDTGIFNYVDETGNEQIVVYQYLPERGWMFAIQDTSNHVYSSLRTIKKVTAVSCGIIGVTVIIFLIIILSGLTKDLGIIRTSIERLGKLNLSPEKRLEKYRGQKDEVGIVCDTLRNTSLNLSRYLREVDKQLSDMANGDFRQSEDVVFEGDFKTLQESLIKIRKALRESFQEIGYVTKELAVGSQSVSTASVQLASSAGNASNLVMEIDQNIVEITSQIAETAEFAAQAQKESSDASTLVEISQSKMDELCRALADIDRAAKAIEGISGQIEGIAKQTNILALNAMVEASRAGDAGLGFGVVADEIRVLAAKSNEASANAFHLIQEAQRFVGTGMEIGKETSEHLSQVVVQTETIDQDVSKIADAAMLQNEALSAISARIADISKMVESTAAMAQQSAAASEELDGQAVVLKENIAKYRV